MSADNHLMDVKDELDRLRKANALLRKENKRLTKILSESPVHRTKTEYNDGGWAEPCDVCGMFCETLLAENVLR